jgi:hypothetical protein
MAYTPQAWANDAAGGTPISAARLTHIEDGVEDADARLTIVEPAVVAAAARAVALAVVLGGN